MTKSEAAECFEWDGERMLTSSAVKFVSSLSHVDRSLPSPRNKSLTVGQEIDMMTAPLKKDGETLSYHLAMSYVRMRKAYNKYLDVEGTSTK